MFPLPQSLVSKEKDHCQKTETQRPLAGISGGSREPNILPVILSSRVAGLTPCPGSNCQLGLRQCVGGLLAILCSRFPGRILLSVCGAA
jgi:hypothetical protein